MSGDTVKVRGFDALAILQRHGLATLLVLYLLWRQTAWIEADRKERTEVLAQLSQNIAAQTVTLRDLASAEREHAESARTVLASRGDGR